MNDSLRWMMYLVTGAVCLVLGAVLGGTHGVLFFMSAWFLATLLWEFVINNEKLNNWHEKWKRKGKLQ